MSKLNPQEIIFFLEKNKITSEIFPKHALNCFNLFARF